MSLLFQIKVILKGAGIGQSPAGNGGEEHTGKSETLKRAA
jgi:hypothetical protein